MAESTGSQQRKAKGRPFPKGVSGNPAGRPRGARNKASVLAQKLMEDQTEAVVNAVIAAALGGDMTACKLIVERLVPPAKERPIKADLQIPTTLTAANAGKVFSQIFRAVSKGGLQPGEGKALVEMMQAYLQAHEYAELAERIEELEQTTPRGRKW